MKLVNEAGWERIIRVILGAAILYLGWGGVVSGGLGTFMKVFGFLPLLTGLTGTCPAYLMMKFRTNKVEVVSQASDAE